MPNFCRGNSCGWRVGIGEWARENASDFWGWEGEWKLYEGFRWGGGGGAEGRRGLGWGSLVVLVRATGREC